MSHELLIVERYTYLVEHGKVNEVIPYLAENVIFYTFNGIIYGRSNVITYLRDSIRYMHYKRSFQPWRQRECSFNSPLQTSIESSEYKHERNVNAQVSRRIGGSDSSNSSNSKSDVSNLLASCASSGSRMNGESFACFEREGKIIAKITEVLPRYYRVRETVVVQNDLIAVYTLTRLL